MSRGSPVSHHEDELGVGKEIYDVGAHLDGERILVAQPGGGLAVLGDDLQGEGGDGGIQHRLGDAGLFEAHGLLLGLEPVEAHLEEAGDHARFLPAPGTEATKF